MLAGAGAGRGAPRGKGRALTRSASGPGGARAARAPGRTPSAAPSTAAPASSKAGRQLARPTKPTNKNLSRQEQAAMPRAPGARARQAQHQPLGRLGVAAALAVIFLGSLTPGFSRSLPTPAFAAPLPAPERGHEPVSHFSRNTLIIVRFINRLLVRPLLVRLNLKWRIRKLDRKPFSTIYTSKL